MLSMGLCAEQFQGKRPDTPGPLGGHAGQRESPLSISLKCRNDYMQLPPVVCVLRHQEVAAC
jgi:hypothetical protein